MQRSRCESLLFILAMVCVCGLHAQSTPGSDAAGDIVFKASARTVIVDVVVTGKNGQPVTGLHKEDFLAAEDGKPQTITSFEEHLASTEPTPALPKLPADIFTNIPRIPPTDSVTVLLLDSLNTPIADQAFVHRRMLKYLQELQPGKRLAIFTLGRQLRYVQGFTDDPALLSAALRSVTRGGGPQSSPMLRSYTESNAMEQALAHLAEMSSLGAAAAAGMAGVQGEQDHFQNDQRVLLTLDAFQKLAAYLSGIPGRKNLVWFSGAFPMVLFSNPKRGESYDIQREYGDKIRQTDSLLSAAQVAIYPIGAEGTAANSLYDVQHDLVGVQGAAGAQQVSVQALTDDNAQRDANHATMDEIAYETGGKAIYDTNGLNEALGRVVDHGARYYTLSYTPANTAVDGQYRSIKVKLVHGKDDLAYRRGYYAADAKSLKVEAPAAGGDPLLHSMTAGLPASTQIPLALRVMPAAAIPGSKLPAAAGDNAQLKGPLKRYAVDFVIAARGLKLDPAATGGGRTGRIEATLVLYDQDGKAVNWMVRQLDLSMDAARYAKVQENGINFRLDIDAPREALTLRSGVYDWNSQMTGTLEVALADVVDQKQMVSAVKK